MVNKIDLFVPGRLCLVGEHSDWATIHRLQNPSISPGTALTITLEQGLHAHAQRIPSNLHLSSALAGDVNLPHSTLLKHARSKSPWRYAAGVAHIIHTRYTINTGVSIVITKASLPPGKGFSSSAAVSVLVTRAYNELCGLRLSVDGVMELAYAGERLTGSMCGRLDQIVALGPCESARMHFDGENVSHERLPQPIGVLYFVVADLNASKDTCSILSGLQRAYSKDCGEAGEKLRNVLGERNMRLVAEIQDAIVKGDAEKIGACMTEWQKGFDEAAIPFCPEQLASPVLHKILQDADVLPLVYGGKGVGSQGDGSVQFITKDRNRAEILIEVLKSKLGTDPHLVTLGEQENAKDIGAPPRKRLKADDIGKVRIAVIPAAGFGTRLFPASRSIRPKALFPVIDKDGMAKPLLLCLIEDCVQAGIEQVIVVVGPGEQEQRVREVFSPVPTDLYTALKPHMRAYADRIAKLAPLVELAVQEEPNGFGHAVSCASVGTDSPFLLLLGDVLFRSNDASQSCVRQVLSAFETNPLKSAIGVTSVPISESVQYGVVKTADGARSNCRNVSIEKLVEKPDMKEAEECARNGVCDIVLGPYVFTPSLMAQLEKDVMMNKTERGEIQLTSAMISVLETEGMNAVRIDGEALDTGNATEYARTISKLAS